MEVTTTHNSPKQKRFSWSYSRLKNFEACGFRYEQVDLLKAFKEEESEQLAWGDSVHKNVAARIRDNTPLPDTMGHVEPWVKRILSNVGPTTRLYVEQKYAINEDFGPTGYFAPDAWFRSIVDVLKVEGDLALACDWKTGKILEDGVQLAMVAACVFAHFPDVNIVRSEFIWLKDDASSRKDFTRTGMADVWREVLPRVHLLEQATRSGLFPPRPGRLCRKYCPVAKCVHHGK